MDPGGGPEDVSVLFGFGGHAARQIWMDDTCHPVLTCHTRAQAIERWHPEILAQEHLHWEGSAEQIEFVQLVKGYNTFN